MIEFLVFILTALKWLIFVDAILSWMMPADKFPRSLTGQLTDPLYAPIRAVLKPERTGGLDLSPILMLVLIWTMERMLSGALAGS